MSLLKLIYDFGSDYLSKYFQSSQEEIEDPQDEINKLLEQLEDSFHEVNDREIQELVEEYIDYPCYQKSGVITSLSLEGGMINKQYNFKKVDAMNVWDKLKVGKKVLFLTHENIASNIEITEELEWEESDKDPKKDFEISEETHFGYQISDRTVIGNVTLIDNEVISIDTGREVESNIDKNDQKIAEIGFRLNVGDLLKLDCTTQEDEESWNPANNAYGKILTIKSIKPTRKRHEIGQVTDVYREYAIIDREIAVLKSDSDISIDLCSKYEFEAIETSIMVEGRNYMWRLTKLIRLVNSENDEVVKNFSKVQLYDANFDFYSSGRDLERYVRLFNKSNDLLKIVSCELTQFSGIVTLVKDYKNVLIHSGGNLEIKIIINTSEFGNFSEDLTVDFGDFQKKTTVNIQVSRKGHQSITRNIDKSRGDIIPGRKVRDAPRFVEIRTKNVDISPELHEIDFKKNSSLIIADLAESHKFLFSKLDQHNYFAKMTYALHLEEIAMKIHFERYKIDRGHFENAGEFLKLEVEGVAEKRPSISIGDKIIARDMSCNEVKTNRKSNPDYEGFIHKVEQNSIYVKFNLEFHSNHNRRDYRIEFFFSRSGIKRQHHALSFVTSNQGLGYEFLFPQKIVAKNPQIDVSLIDGKMMLKEQDLFFFNETLNNYQKEAVVNVLRGENRPLPYIIYGPPGTGKTQTVIEIIEQISARIPSSRIVIATPSNSAANLIIDRLLKTKRYQAGDFVRFVSFHQIEKELIPTELKKYCATIDIALDDGTRQTSSFYDDSGIRKHCSKTTIVQYQIYISTLSSLGPLMNIKFPPDHFTHIIIDEAGQSVETESLIPMTFLSKNRGQVILAGDPIQLGPVLHSYIAKHPSIGFGKSLLERLSEHEFYSEKCGPDGSSFNPNFVTKLKKNYRSIPSVLNVYNKLFYGGELEAEISDKNSYEIELLRKLSPSLWNRVTAKEGCGVFFVNVEGKHMRTKDSNSWCNDHEAMKVFTFICKLKKLGVGLENVGVITPYVLQVKKLRHLIDEVMPNSGLKIGSVEEFQGQERSVIILSTVRTSHHFVHSDITFGLGFLKCEKRMNVAVSRARSLLVIFGKEALLVRDEKWRSLIEITKANGTYVKNA